MTSEAGQPTERPKVDVSEAEQAHAAPPSRALLSDAAAPVDVAPAVEAAAASAAVDLPALDDSKERAKAAIKLLFEHLNINRIVCVDDQYATIANVEQIIGRCEAAPTACTSIQAFRDVAFDDPREIWTDGLRRIWSGLDAAQQRTILEQLNADAPGADAGDAQAAKALRQLMEGFEFRPLSPAAWQEQKDELLKPSAGRHRTLFLFDRELKAGNAENAGVTDGVELVSSLLAEHPHAMCGLVSHTFGTSEEHKEWEKIIDERQLDAARFVLASKQRLHDDPVGFARMVKMATLSPDCKKLQGRIADILTAAQTEAKKRVSQITIYDFEHIVFQSSLSEGVWEPDTLFRVFGLYHRAESRRLAWEDRDVRTIAETIRGLSEVPTRSPGSPKHESWRIQADEMYESGPYINKLHMPIDAGDVFEVEVNGEKRLYILLCQSCDLMVRKSGRRKAKEATVVEVIPPTDDVKGEGYYELPYYGEQDGISKYACFRKYMNVRPDVLDLCAYNADGTAEITLGVDVAPEVIPSMKARYRDITTGAKKTLKAYADLLQRKVPQDLIDRFIPKAGIQSFADPQVDAKASKLGYKCKRVRRFSFPHNTALLAAFHTYLNRAGFAHDIGRDEDDTCATEV